MAQKISGRAEERISGTAAWPAQCEGVCRPSAKMSPAPAFFCPRDSDLHALVVGASEEILHQTHKVQGAATSDHPK
jgi:hypothetical protein